MTAQAQTQTPVAARSASARSIPWLIIICGCLIAALTFGPRSAMGFFQLPMLAEKGWDRTTFGLAMALQNLFWGLSLPFFGAIADRYGTWRVLTLGGLIYAAGLYLMAIADSPTMLHIGGGVLVGLGVAAGSFSIVLAAFARHTPPEKRSIVFGIGTAAGSAGMFLFAPIGQGLIDAYGWSQALIIMAGMMLVIPLLAIPLHGSSHNAASKAVQQTVGNALSEAFAHRSYTLLVSGFFVCGFQVAFITAHFPAYIGDLGIDAGYAVIALALIGFFNIIGSLWLSTVPPTNALVAIMFGTRHLGMLGGVVFLSHQIGSFLGVWLGGYLYDRFGSYDPVWWLGVALGIFAAIVHWPIQEKPVERLQLAPAE